MQKYHRVFAALVTTVALLAAPSVPAQEAKSKAVTKAEAKTKADAKAEAAAKGKDLYPQSYFDFMLKQRTAQGQPDSPELRTAVRDELNTRELLVREAKKQSMEKNPAVKTEMDLTSQTVLVRAYMSDYIKAHPTSHEQLRNESETI